MRRIAFAFLLLAGCASAPSPAELASFDYGPPPNRDEGIAMVEGALKSALKDPDSARFVWPNGFVSGWYKPPFGSSYMGWITCGTVNARNGFGGYVGQSAVIGVIRNGAVIETNMDDATAQYGGFVREACGKIGVPAS